MFEAKNYSIDGSGECICVIVVGSLIDADTCTYAHSNLKTLSRAQKPDYGDYFSTLHHCVESLLYGFWAKVIP